MSLRVASMRVEYEGCPVVVSLDEHVEVGEWLCVIGPNGAGKSSLLRAVAGLVPYSGSVTIAGREVSGLAPRDSARHVAFVPQDPVLPDDMSVADYVLLGRNPYVATFGRESSHDRDVVAGLIDDLSLRVYARRMLGTLSGGERQRVVIARALAQEAPVMLLDEPTSALDVGHQQHALELVDRLRRERGLTVVSAMHDLTLAGLYSDRLVLMLEGTRVAAGTAAEVLVPDVLAECYGASVRVHTDPDGTVVVVPVRPRSGTVPG